MKKYVSLLTKMLLDMCMCLCNLLLHMEGIYIVSDLKINVK